MYIVIIISGIDSVSNSIIILTFIFSFTLICLSDESFVISKKVYLVLILSQHATKCETNANRNNMGYTIGFRIVNNKSSNVAFRFLHWLMI